MTISNSARLPVDPGELHPHSFTSLELLADPVALLEVVDGRGSFIAANAAYRARLDRDPIGLDALTVLGGRWDHEYELIGDAIESGAPGRIETDRGAAVIEVRADPHHDERGTCTHVLVSTTDVTERASLAARVAHDAAHDATTRLPNGEALAARIRSAFGRSEPTGRGAAVVILDLDQYRAVRDGLGHGASDELLYTVARRLERVVRFGDLVARLGGDEFAVFCSDVGGEDEAQEIAQRVQAVVAEPVVLDSGEVFVSATVGIALRQAAADSPERIMRDAHAALSAAKRAGRGSVVVFDDSLRAGAVARLELEKSLHRALRREEFRVYYQPLVQFAGAAIVGFEALLRWDDPDRGIVAPMDFIPVAEETGLIVPIGEWVVREVCRQAAAWGAATPGAEPLVVSVNLSARQLAHPDLVGVFASALADSGVAPETILVEVTESVIMRDPQLATAILHALRALGVRIAIDDFGTGHSSLGYLKQLPVDCLKIDRSFVAGLGIDPDDRAIVRAVVAMAHALGLSVTAEGIETTQQLGELESLGCDVGQGFYFARPQPGEVVAALVRHRFHWRRAA